MSAKNMEEIAGWLKELKFQKKIIGDEKPITCRPADLIEPQLEKFRARLAEDGYPNASMEDLLSYISFPEVAKAFFGHNR